MQMAKCAFLWALFIFALLMTVLVLWIKTLDVQKASAFVALVSSILAIPVSYKYCRKSDENS